MSSLVVIKICLDVSDFSSYEFRKAHFVKFISASTTFEHFFGDFCFLCCYYVNKVIM